MGIIMPLKMKCGRCGSAVAFEEEDRGTEVYCWSCGGATVVPLETEPPGEAAASPSPSVGRQDAAAPAAAVRVSVAPAAARPSPAQVSPAPQPKPFDLSSEKRVRWVLPTSDQPGVKRLPLRNCAAVDAQGRILAAIQNDLVALAPSGEVLWSYATGGFIPGSPALGPDGGIRVHSSDGSLHCVDGNGQRLWPPVDVGEPLGWAMPVIDESSQTWICLASGGLSRIDARGQASSRPFFRSLQRFDSTGVIYQGVYYVGSDFDACVYAIRLTGERGENLWDHAAGRGRTGWSINASLALGDGPLLYVPCRDDHLYAFRLDGALAWKAPIGGQARASVVVDGDQRLYLGVSHAAIGTRERGELLCLDSTTQSVRFRYEANGPVESTPVIGEDGIIYFGDNAGTIHAVNAHGQGIWKQHVGAAVRSAGSIAPEGLLLFGLDDGRLLALEASSRQVAERTWPKMGGSARQAGIGPPGLLGGGPG